MCYLKKIDLALSPSLPPILLRSTLGVGLLLKTSLVVLVSQLVGILLPLATAVVLQQAGQSMSWFSTPLLVVPLFFLPSLLGWFLVNKWWRKQVSEMEVAHLFKVPTL